MGMVSSILVVCVGNICRSPLAERVLKADLLDAEISVSSAGLGALVGMGADSLTSEVAARRGLSLDDHIARQFTPAIGRENDLILVMEASHRSAILRQAVELSGRCLLLDQWTGNRDIPDPYQKSQEFHEIIFSLVKEASDAWITRMNALSSGRRRAR